MIDAALCNFVDCIAVWIPQSKLVSSFNSLVVVRAIRSDTLSVQESVHGNVKGGLGETVRWGNFNW